jgi:hypothetical protein
LFVYHFCLVFQEAREKQRQNYEEQKRLLMMEEEKMRQRREEEVAKRRQMVSNVFCTCRILSIVVEVRLPN